MPCLPCVCLARKSLHAAKSNTYNEVWQEKKQVTVKPLFLTLLLFRSVYSIAQEALLACGVEES